MRYIDVDAQRIGLCQQEHGAAGAAAGINQVTDINIAAGDDTGKRCDDPFEPFKLTQALGVGVGCREVGGGLGAGAAPLIEFLLRYGVLGAQRLPARQCAFGQSKAGCGLFAGGDRLRQLLVDFRRVEFGKQVAFFDAAADVLVPAPQVTTGACGDR